MVIRKFHQLRSVPAAAQRAETGLVAMLKRLPGFQGYCIFDAGNGIGGSITFFDDKETATQANERALAWVRASIADLYDGEPEILTGDILYSSGGPFSGASSKAETAN
jgi:hypothetical protein